MIEWARLCRVPDERHLSEIVPLLMAHLSAPLANRSGSAVCDALGWRYSVRPIGQPTSPVRSMLGPLLVGGFSVVVNAHHQHSDLDALWLTLHEVGHSLFYAEGRPPRRIIPCSPAEERFCDRLADEMTASLPARTTLQFA